MILVQSPQGVGPIATDDERVQHYQRVFLEQLLEVNPDFHSAYRNNPECLTPSVVVYEHGQGPFEGETSKIKQRHIYRGPL